MGMASFNNAHNAPTGNPDRDVQRGTAIISSKMARKLVFYQARAINRCQAGKGVI